MQKRTEIGKRLYQLRIKNHYSQSEIAAELHITQAAYSLIEASKNGLVAEHILRLSDFYDVPTDYILKGVKNLIKLSRENGFFPYVPIKAQAGFVKNHSREISEDEYEYFRIPGYSPDLDLKLFEIEGESMVPSMFPGDVVISQKVDLKKVKKEDAILVITKDAVLAKRVLEIQNNGDLLLMNDNPELPEGINIPGSSIKEVLVIRGKISNRLVPSHQMVGKGRIEEIMQSLEFLKKEIYSISQKVEAKGRKMSS